MKTKPIDKEEVWWMQADWYNTGALVQSQNGELYLVGQHNRLVHLNTGNIFEKPISGKYALVGYKVEISN